MNRIMNTKILYGGAMFLLTSLLITCAPKQDHANEQVNAALEVIERILPEHAHRLFWS